MGTNCAFNKEIFAVLLEKAKGNKSINEYSRETGVSTAYISKLLRQLNDKPPSPEIISKLAFFASNDITYKQLMVASGHIACKKRSSSTSYKDIKSLDDHSPNNKQVVQIENFRRLNQIFLGELVDKHFKWVLEEKQFPFDLVMRLQDAEFDRWNIIFQSGLICDDTYSSSLFTYGHLSVIELNEIEKVTIATNVVDLYNSYLNNKPINLRLNLFIMLIDIDKNRVISEEQISSCK